ncbi:hypothetical protein [Phyllobacterium endophyticum]|uniref:Uncharacterized protein n=1 Tax=Phyllobacterium endophyticum TaxID=1149773 RepID=A0A2P7AP22_9HYPH|nr:hypothetical protein [Phyllobacterium endophyticum]PSH55959.1 hypothetical protein CU100_20180 [Phyllobacterium endophyticum]TXR47185.1 hypothetical protein FVA77_20795 [Phyllobacterium endophyticum]TYR41102.1 hypothetical protein FY050_07195 [Phyllobacterium endophyticum]
MIRILLIGLWICAVALGSLYVAVWQNSATAAVGSEAIEILDDGKTDVFSVPIIIDNAVQGYVVSQLAYTLDHGVNASFGIPVSYFINDEIFRQFYGHYSDVKEVQKVNFDDVRKAIIDGVNARFPQPLVKDLLVEQFNYITAQEIRDQNTKGVKRQ